MMNPKISVCITVKDNEQTLESCLNSVLSFAHEIVVLDRGSSDKTKNIARKFAKKVFQSKFEDDLAKAKNECMKYASGDWIFFAEPGEKVSEKLQNDIFKILSEPKINNLRNEAPVFAFRVIKEESDGSFFSFYRETLFKARSGFQYINPVGEQLTSSKKTAAFYYHDLTLRENSAPEIKRTKTKEKITLILKNKDIFTPEYRFYYHLAYEHYVLEDYNPAAENFLKAREYYINSSVQDINLYNNLLIMLFRTFTKNNITYPESLEGDYLKLQKDYPGFPDLHYYQAIRHKLAGNTGLAAEEFEKASQIKMEKGNYAPLISADGLESQILTGLAECMIIENNEDKAYEYLIKSWNINQNYRDTLLLLVYLYIRKGELTRALELSAKTIKSIENTKDISQKKQKLDILEQLSKEKLFLNNTKLHKQIEEQKKELLPVPKISVCIIARNEERYIEQALKSVIPAAYEIIVLDTGSTDRTKEIVRAYCNTSLHNLHNIRLYETTWEDDFAKARNECISYATGDWILSIDADEVLTEQTQKNLLPFLARQPLQDVPVVFSFEGVNTGSTKGAVYYKHRLFRNNMGIRYIRPVHEHLSYDGPGELKDIDCPFLKTKRYVSGQTQKLFSDNEYTAKLIKAIENNPDPNDNYYYYYFLGTHYSKSGEHNKALEAFYNSYQFYNKKFSTSERESFYGSIIIVLVNELIYFHEKYSEAIKYIAEFLAASPEFPDMLYFLGICYHKTGRYNRAIEVYNQALNNIFDKAKDHNPLNVISLGEPLAISIVKNISHCFLLRNDFEKSLYYLRLGFKMFPDNKEVIRYLLLYYLLLDNLGEALKFYQILKKKISKEKKEALKSVSAFPTGHYEYQSAILFLLKEIKTSEVWDKEQLNMIGEKIAAMELIKGKDNK